jgi:murein DD-endopeptidase MepM/ murein hydrolase activator NlpD
MGNEPNNALQKYNFAPQQVKSFAQNKGKLPFPVARGTIVSYFGKREHPTLKGVQIDNDGIDIRTNPGEAVKAVYDGVVSTIATVPAMGGEVVMLRHGEYLTVYAKVKNILVKVGQRVKKGQMIATVFMDKKGISQLQFQVWKTNQKLNPNEWLAKR